MARERSRTPALGKGQCGYCGAEAVPLPDCAVPTRAELAAAPYATTCVRSPRWRWCPRTWFFAAWYGPGEPPATIPGTPFPGVPS